MKNEKISIIIPVYNVKKYLNKCINSVLNQTYKNIEIILVDDKSTDNSDKICDKYAKQDKRIKVIHREKNGGLSAARNTGMENATGEYLFFLDSDDSITHNAMEMLYNKSKKYNSEITIGKIQEVYEDGSTKLIVDIESNNEEELKYTNIEALEAMLYNTVITNSACNKLYKRELFTDITFPIGKHYEDLGTIYKVISKATTVVVYNKPTYLYLVNRNGSIMNSKYTSKRLEAVTFAQEILDFVKKEFPLIEIAAINRLYIECVFVLMQIPSSKQYQKDRKRIKQILKKYKYKVIFNMKMPKKQKMLSIISLFGKYPLRFAWNIKEKFLKR